MTRRLPPPHAVTGWYPVARPATILPPPMPTAPVAVSRGVILPPPVRDGGAS